jgi:serine/threonine protein kinase
MAPEVITGKESGYNERADIWSLGITAIEMAKGFPPRVEQQPAKVVMTIVQSDPPKLEGNFSPNFKNFVAACLKKDPKEVTSHNYYVYRKKLILIYLSAIDSKRTSESFVLESHAEQSHVQISSRSIQKMARSTPVAT